ncbi:glyoxalase [Tamlana sedimentorum]|uniref:Glyoxalase n=1 Tax=Neotamlana sedimentorum TaxID=1435349 RepID=A0A0D7WBY2_9FLAO|nr:VOC family protein [Tamlana sedimentorum]KJD36198.1 glyoxalase [Tamlana sedimentorum]
MEHTPINYIEFKAKNLHDIKTFYTACFNWAFTDYGDQYIAFKNSGVEGGFEKTDSEIVNGVLVVLHHNNLDEVKAKVLKHGGQISVDIFAFPGGKRFQFLDPSGNELAVWCAEKN